MTSGSPPASRTRWMRSSTRPSSNTPGAGTVDSRRESMRTSGGRSGAIRDRSPEFQPAPSTFGFVGPRLRPGATTTRARAPAAAPPGTGSTTPRRSSGKKRGWRMAPQIGAARAGGPARAARVAPRRVFTLVRAIAMAARDSRWYEARIPLGPRRAHGACEAAGSRDEEGTGAEGGQEDAPGAGRQASREPCQGREEREAGQAGGDGARREEARQGCRTQQDDLLVRRRSRRRP